MKSNQYLRDTKQYKEWRQKIFKRDKGMCIFPKCRRKGKHVHHIMRYSDNPTLIFNERNACTLCYQHHRQVTGKELIYASLLFGEVAKKYK